MQLPMTTLTPRIAVETKPAPDLSEAHSAHSSPEQAAPATEIQVDAEFAGIIPPPSQDEMANLEASLQAEGLREPLVVWTERHILLDGHNRLILCRKLGIEPRVTYRSFADRASAKLFIFQMQFARRNLTPEALSYLRGKHYLMEKGIQGGDRPSLQADYQTDTLPTAKRLARAYKVGEATINRDAKFARAVDEIVEHCGEMAKQLILSRDTRLTRAQILALSRRTANEQQRYFQDWKETGKRPKAGCNAKSSVSIVLPRETKGFVQAILRSFTLDAAAGLATALVQAIENTREARKVQLKPQDGS